MHALEMSFLCKLGLVRKVCSSRLYVNTMSYSRASRDDSCWSAGTFSTRCNCSNELGDYPGGERSSSCVSFLLSLSLALWACR